MDRWYWRAAYNDGTSVSQLEINPATGRQWSSEHVDFSKLAAIILEPRDGKSNRVLLQVREGERPKRFWRQYMAASGPATGARSTCWVLCLEKDGHQFCTFFRPDGTIVISTDYNGGSEFNVPVDDRLTELAKVTPVG